MHASIQKRIPESRRMAGRAVGNRRCLKVPIFADAVWAKRCCRRCSEPGWHSRSHYMTLWVPRDFPVYTQPLSMKWQWPDRVTASLVLGLLSHNPWYQRGFVESGPWKTILQVVMCSDWGDLLPKTVHFLPFRQPRCYSGLWAGTAPRPAGIAPAGRWASCCWLTLHSACFPLNPLNPQFLGLPFCPKIGSILGKLSTHAPGRGGPVCAMPLGSLGSAACSAQQQGHFGVVTLNLPKVITLLEVWFKHSSFWVKLPKFNLQPKALLINLIWQFCLHMGGDTGSKTPSLIKSSGSFSVHSKNKNILKG